jgi:hypothetical protein
VAGVLVLEDATALVRVDAAAAIRATPPWQGRLAIAADRSGFVDQAGAYVLPLCAHFGEAFSAYVRRPGDVEQQLRAIEAAGYDCIRFWDNLGEYSDGWRGKEVTPFAWTNGDGVRVSATPDYYGQLRGFVALLKRVGLAAHHSRGDLGRASLAIPLERVVQHAERVAAIYDQVGWDVLALAEANNEDWQNGNLGPERLRAVVAPFKARGALTALSCPPHVSEAHADLNAYSDGASVFIVHGNRERATPDRFRAIFSIAYEHGGPRPRLGWQGEPIGPGAGVTIAQVHDVEELGLLGLQALIARQAWNYMCGPCVFWNGPIDRQPGFAAVPRLRDVLRAFAPDVMRWRLTHGGREDAPLRSTTGYIGDAGVTRGPARVNIAVHPEGRKYVAIVAGGRGPRELRNALSCPARLTIVHPESDETVATRAIEIAPNEAFPLDYRVGRMILGECR